MGVMFVDFEDGDDEEIDIDDVDASSDERELGRWFSSMLETRERVRAFIEAHRLADNYHEEWFERAGRKVAYLRIGMKRVENRMLTLGFRPPYPPSDPRIRQMHAIEEKNRKLRALLKAHGIEDPTRATQGESN